MKKIIAGILIGWLTLPALTAQRTTNEIPLTPIEYETCPYGEENNRLLKEILRKLDDRHGPCF